MKVAPAAEWAEVGAVNTPKGAQSEYNENFVLKYFIVPILVRLLLKQVQLFNLSKLLKSLGSSSKSSTPTRNEYYSPTFLTEVAVFFVATCRFS